MGTTRILRHIDAPPHRVYEALIDPSAVERWMVPDNMTSHVHHFDARVGGTFRISLTYDEPTAIGKTDGHTDTFHGRFVKLIPGRELVQTIEFETGDPEIIGEMTVRYSLSDAAGGTNLIGIHEHLPPGIDPKANEVGWGMSIDKLASLVEGEAQVDHPTAS